MAQILIQKDIMIHFDEADPQGIMYFTHAQKIAHQCLEEFCAESPIGWEYWFNNAEFAVPIKNISTNFLNPCRAGHSYIARLSLIEIKESAVILACDIIDARRDEETICAQTQSVHVFVDRGNFKKIAIPEKIKLVFAQK